MASAGTSSSYGEGLHLMPSKFANMDDWFMSSLMEQAAGEGLEEHHHHHHHQQQQQQQHHYSLSTLEQHKASSSSSSHPSDEEIKSAILGHPQYRELITAHMNCHKVGAPAHLVAEMDELIRKHQDFQPSVTTSIGANPELDQFMVAYCNVLQSYEHELKRTFKEAIEFCKRLEQQLCIISNGSVDALASAAAAAAAQAESDERNEGADVDEEEAESADAGVDVDPLAGDKELKRMLMLKYGAFIRGLTHEYLKKKKKGKLPKESRQKLLDWWAQHQEHPYPSEAQKASLARSTGLDPKQINNWFINQRKRHWNPGAAAASAPAAAAAAASVSAAAAAAPSVGQRGESSQQQGNRDGDGK